MEFRKAFSLIIFLFLLLAGCSGNHEAKLKPLPPNATIVAFGDSLTFGTGVRQNDSYPAILSRLIHYRVINAGMPGETSEQGLERISNVLKKYHPNLVILCLGGNDALRRIKPQETEKNLQKIITKIKATGADIVLLGVPEVSLGMKTPAYYSKLAKKFDIPLDSSSLKQLLKKQEFKSDFVHFNKKGYKKLAQQIEELLKENGAIQ